MKNYKSILPFLLLFLCFSCKNSNLESGGSMDDIDNTTIGSDSSNSPNTPPEEQYSPQPPSKEIEWADGNTYTYDYIEQIQWKDSTGTRNVTVYIKNKPTNVDCEIKQCKWCSIEIQAQGYTIDEYPNLDVQREKSNIKEGFESLGSMLQMLLSFDNPKNYFDLENDRIRTEWRVNCDYGGPDGFCSMKCQSEYNKR